MKQLIKLITAMSFVIFSGHAFSETKIVYHVNEGVQQASRAIGNIRNHLNADPTAKIVVVTHGPGIDFLLEGAENMAGSKFSASIGDLVSKGVNSECVTTPWFQEKFLKSR